MNPADSPTALQIWQQYHDELQHFLLAQLRDPDDAEDLLHELFLKLINRRDAGQPLQQPRAWLYRVARNALIDRHRAQHPTETLPDTLASESKETPVIDQLDHCLLRNLAEMADEERLIIEQCDLQGVPQQQFADQHQLTLSATKSRLQRARRKLRTAIVRNCQVGFDDIGHVCCYTPRP